jgi:hypothetical protein
LEGLIPGWTYNANASAPRKLRGEVTDLVIGQPFENVQVQAGERKDLGDLVIGAKQLDEQEDVKDEPLAQEAKAPSITGRVTASDGRPVAGAQVAVIAMSNQRSRGGDFTPRGQVLAEGTTAENGEYELTLADASSKTHAYANVIARKDGLAIAWRQIDLDAATIDAPLVLSPDEPIRVRLIDIEGQPATGVKLSISALIERTENERPTLGVGFRGADLPAAWLPAVTSDEQGRTLRHSRRSRGLWRCLGR